MLVQQFTESHRLKNKIMKLLGLQPVSFHPLMFFLSIDVFSTVQFKKKTCLATQNIRSVALSRYECAEMQDRFSVFIQV